jgi:hypothetical protein
VVDFKMFDPGLIWLVKMGLHVETAQYGKVGCDVKVLKLRFIKG